MFASSFALKRAMSFSCFYQKAIWGLLIVLGVSVCVNACDEGSKKRACEPVTGKGCKGSKVCALKFDGTPKCFASAGQGKEGDACDSPDGCAKGLGCVRLFGVARCTRFCDPESEKDPCQSAGIVESSMLLPNALTGHCAAALFEREDIGVCVVACEGDSCPENSHCGTVVGWREPVCVSDTALDQFTLEVENGKACGGNVVCKKGSACVELGEVAVCRALADESGCKEGEDVVLARLQSDAREEDSGVSEDAAADAEDAGAEAFVKKDSSDASTDTDEERVQVCAPCSLLGISSSEGEFVMCGKPAVKENACPEGALASLSAMPSLVLEALMPDPESTTSFWTSATRQEDTFLWSDGSEVESDLWAAEEPKTEGDCALWTSSGLVVSDCAFTAPGLCLIATVDRE